MTADVEERDLRRPGDPEPAGSLLAVQVLLVVATVVPLACALGLLVVLIWWMGNR